MSSKIEKYYTHTKEGHNKDYRMIIDFSTLTLECHWGPIGGTKQIDRYKTENMTELTDLINEKHLRRIDHGYTDASATSIAPSKKYYSDDISAEQDFYSDVADLIAAEAVSS